MELVTKTSPCFLMLYWVTPALSYPTGAPVNACVSMTPNHNTSASDTDSPYTVNITEAAYKHGQMIKVKIMSSEPYRGIFLQARHYNSSTIAGSWKDLPANIQTINCGSGTSNAVTHTSRTEKPLGLVYTWIAPSSNGPEKIVFQATVVKNKTIFWTNIRSSELQLDTSGAASGLKMSVSTLMLLLVLVVINSV
ncbi:putative defense protein 3 [Lepisosteus oculatus]|uniref:Putative defense protein 3 n=1 Tax=Lepisosteus oculatus TaxID=7918 RepID=W5M452_LEPOC|nr:PREDICTED: putative defense protein 3 [Lepisosteus oculatus]